MTKDATKGSQKFVEGSATCSWMLNRVLNRIILHFPVSEGNNRVDNRIANNRKIIG